MHIVGGKPLRKNNWRRTSRHPDALPGLPAIVVERPGRDARHLVRPAHVRAFLPLLPEWPVLLDQLRAVVLAATNPWADAAYGHSRRSGEVELYAWPREIPQRWHADYVHEHRSILDRLGVPRRPEGTDVFCDFTEGQARAFQLVHVLVHELGHHRDRLTTRSQNDCARGEIYAESYALEHEALLLRRWAELDPSALG